MKIHRNYFVSPSGVLRLVCLLAFTMNVSCIKKNRKELDKKIIRGSSSSDLIREISPATLSVKSEVIAKNTFLILEISGESEKLFNKISLCPVTQQSPSSCRQVETIQTSYILSGFPEGIVSATVIKCHQDKREWCSKPTDLSFNYVGPQDKKLEKFITNKMMLDDAAGAVSKDIYKSVLEYQETLTPEDPDHSKIENIKLIGQDQMAEIYKTNEFNQATSAMTKHSDGTDSSDVSITQSQDAQMSTIEDQEKRIQEMKNLFTAGQAVLALGTPVFAAGLIMTIGANYAKNQVNSSLDEVSKTLNKSFDSLDQTINDFDKLMDSRLDTIKGTLKQSLKESVDGLLMRDGPLTQTQIDKLKKHNISSFAGQLDDLALKQVISDDLNTKGFNVPWLGDPTDPLRAGELRDPIKVKEFLDARFDGDERALKNFARKHFAIDEGALNQLKIDKGSYAVAVQELFIEKATANGPWAKTVIRKEMNTAISNFLSQTNPGAKLNDPRVPVWDSDALDGLFKKMSAQNVDLMTEFQVKKKIEILVKQGVMSPVDYVPFNPKQAGDGDELIRLKTELKKFRASNQSLTDLAMENWYKQNLRSVLESSLYIGNTGVHKVEVYNIRGSDYSRWLSDIPIHYTIDESTRQLVDGILMGGEESFKSAMKSNVGLAGDVADEALEGINKSLDSTFDQLKVTGRQTLIAEAGTIGADGKPIKSISQILTEKRSHFTSIINGSPEDIAKIKGLSTGTEAKSLKQISGDATSNLSKYGKVTMVAGLAGIVAGIILVSQANMKLTSETMNPSQAFIKIAQLSNRYETIYNRKLSNEDQMRDYIKMTYPGEIE